MHWSDSDEQKESFYEVRYVWNRLIWSPYINNNHIKKNYN